MMPNGNVIAARRAFVPSHQPLTDPAIEIAAGAADAASQDTARVGSSMPRRRHRNNNHPHIPIAAPE
jgi:hypothetical protein